MFKNIFVRVMSRAQEAAKGGIGGGAGGGGGKGGGGGAIAAVGTLTLIGGGLAGAYYSVVTVQPGHQGIVYKLVLNQLIPKVEAKMVSISLRVLFRPDPNELPFIYRRLGKDFDVRVLPSIVNEVTKAVVAQYNASELLTKRNVVSKQIRDMLVQRSNDFKIVLDDVAITHLAFSKEYTAAVEAKQVAQQEAERAKYIVERAIQEKKSIVIKAEGEAKSAELIGNAIQRNPAFVQLRRIEASKEIANTIISSSNKVYLSADSLMINSLGDSFKDALDGEDSEPAPAPVKKAGYLW